MIVEISRTDIGFIRDKIGAYVGFTQFIEQLKAGDENQLFGIAFCHLSYLWSDGLKVFFGAGLFLLEFATQLADQLYILRLRILLTGALEFFPGFVFGGRDEVEEARLVAADVTGGALLV